MLTIDFDRIARNNCSALYQRALRLTRNAAQAWDLVQDTFERSLRHFPAQLPATKVRAWLLVIMRNLFLDRVRSPESRFFTSTGEQDWPDLAANSEEEEEQQQRSRSERFRTEDVKACLDQLPPVLRQAYELHAFGNLSYREIAGLLNLRAATVGTRILRARRRLCELLLAGTARNQQGSMSQLNAPEPATAVGERWPRARAEQSGSPQSS